MLNITIKFKTRDDLSSSTSTLLSPDNPPPAERIDRIEEGFPAVEDNLLVQNDNAI